MKEQIKIILYEDDANSSDVFDEFINSIKNDEGSKCSVDNRRESFDTNEIDNQEIAVRNALIVAKEMNSIVNHISYAKEVLREELSLLEKAQEDLLKKIASDKFNVVVGYKLMQRIKQIRIKRRTVKNNLCIYESLYTANLKDEELMKNIIDRAKRIEGPVTYNPRVLKAIQYKFNDNKNTTFKDIKKEELISFE